MLFSKTSLYDYERLCSLDYLGIVNRRKNSYHAYEKFLKQLRSGPRTFFETNLI